MHLRDFNDYGCTAKVEENDVVIRVPFLTREEAEDVLTVAERSFATIDIEE